MSQFSVFAGIDVSKDHLDVHVLPEGGSWRVANDEAGCAQLSKRLTGLSGPVLVVMEATNVFWRLAATELASVGISAAVVNPRQVRDFARATGQLAKTDAIDAYVLALFAQRIEPPVRALASAQCQVAAELLARRAQLMGMRVAEKNRLGTARATRVRKDITITIAFLDKRIAGLDEEIDHVHIAVSEPQRETAGPAHDHPRHARRRGPRFRLRWEGVRCCSFSAPMACVRSTLRRARLS